MPGTVIEHAAALAGLQDRCGYLRAQIAEAVVRRRVPELTFTIAAGPEVSP